ncbi:DUF192 domain-containing protein [Cyanobium sp. HWJ4-Hawea]|uniref:DUF192 domain-containing protein n=1 Tax=Cyanobium sp. HWJ4-Hawea TaxID=2823713 RepID=UPI0020CF864C|nr:DUF192 domain-containing protein [Cyanobium sp. HWJ4-Hawea]MCP9808035.1 DUF192 domain-containing protein [Cyanobium sp. HWJ4-Hawea]
MPPSAKKIIRAALALAPILAGASWAAPPQYLPVEAQWCLAKGPCIQLEVPNTPQQYAWGLQLRPPLSPLRGMWFRFEPAGVQRFWMHRTPEPLDILFVRNGQVLAIEAKVPPCMHLPCRSYGPDLPVDGVIELAAGRSQQLGIGIGSPVTIRPVPPATRTRD